MDPEELASKYFRHFAVFKDGFPEEWIKCLLVDGLPGDREPDALDETS
jgi:hypothetical protein